MLQLTALLRTEGNAVLQLALPYRPTNVGEIIMNDFRDIQHGVNDPVNGVDVKRKFNDNQTRYFHVRHSSLRRSTSRREPNQLS